VGSKIVTAEAQKSKPWLCAGVFLQGLGANSESDRVRVSAEDLDEHYDHSGRKKEVRRVQEAPRGR